MQLAHRSGQGTTLIPQATTAVRIVQPVPAEVLDACRALSLRAVETLRELLTSPNHAVRLGACSALLDRAWGKPEQTMNLAGSLDVNAQRAETEAMVEALKRLDITELRLMIGFYRKAGLALPGETTE